MNAAAESSLGVSCLRALEANDAMDKGMSFVLSSHDGSSPAMLVLVVPLDRVGSGKEQDVLHATATECVRAAVADHNNRT